jgi:threonine/homoserine/homoserine lactone efflux protein
VDDEVECFTAVGVATGQTTWGVAAAIGVGSLLIRSEPTFHAVRLIGAAYLVMLGMEAPYHSLRHPVNSSNLAASHAPAGLRPAVALREGVISNLVNPKKTAFFPALPPQFVPDAQRAHVAMLLLGGIFAAMTLIWLIGYSFAIAKLQQTVMGALWPSS